VGTGETDEFEIESRATASVSLLDWRARSFHIFWLVVRIRSRNFYVETEVKKSVAKAAGKKTIQKLSQMSAQKTERDSIRPSPRRLMICAHCMKQPN